LSRLLRRTNHGDRPRTRRLSSVKLKKGGEACSACAASLESFRKSNRSRIHLTKHPLVLLCAPERFGLQKGVLSAHVRPVTVLHCRANDFVPPECKTAIRKDRRKIRCPVAARIRAARRWHVARGIPAHIAPSGARRAPCAARRSSIATRSASVRW
jgi:hypothetical protein